MSGIIQSEIISPLLGVIQIGILVRVILKLIAAHGDDRGFFTAINQCKKLILAGGIAICITDVVSQIQNCFSGDIFDGIQKLLNEAAAALTLFEISYVVFMLISIGLSWQQEPDEGGMYQKKIISTLMIGALVVTATQVIPIIFGYF